MTIATMRRNYYLKLCKIAAVTNPNPCKTRIQKRSAAGSRLSDPLSLSFA